MDGKGVLVMTLPYVTSKTMGRFESDGNGEP